MLTTEAVLEELGIDQGDFDADEPMMPGSDEEFCDLEDVLSVLKGRYQLESTAEIGVFQELILPLNRRTEGSIWYINEIITQVLEY